MILVTGATGNVGADVAQALASIVRPTVEEVTGRPPRTFEQWAVAHRRLLLVRAH
ncbi:hypothetical protein HLB23_03120 [Nocardia uniformis]|uniref:Uncharacterized protein n=1 Tax=Nocardia uniformis TaxID=53432 RepID=A0A849BXN6_9NOCA|nr:hypothetical protein [Nocardia uniformis]NNH68875.1 hypothetical protein [Nocardia uniformis]